MFWPAGSCNLVLFEKFIATCYLHCWYLCITICFPMGLALAFALIKPKDTVGVDRQFPIVRHCNDTAWKIFGRNVVIITVVKDKRMNTSFVMTMVKVMIV